MKTKMKKQLVIAATFSAMLSMSAFAGSWQSDANGWWYDNGNGTWPASQWEWIDGNNDGVAECYYFDQNGYCLMNTTTPDGYSVDGNGAWIINGTIQTKEMHSTANNETAGTTDVAYDQEYEFLSILKANGFQKSKDLYYADIWCDIRPETLTDQGNYYVVSADVYSDKYVDEPGVEYDCEADHYVQTVIKTCQLRISKNATVSVPYWLIDSGKYSFEYKFTTNENNLRIGIAEISSMNMLRQILEKGNNCFLHYDENGYIAEFAEPVAG